MSPETVSSLLTIGTAVAVVAIGVMNKLDARRAEQVRNDIHTLVNSNMGIQLRANSVLLRRIAALPDATPEDAQMADDAQHLWEEHQAKQKVVDDRNRK